MALRGEFEGMRTTSTTDQIEKYRERYKNELARFETGVRFLELNSRWKKIMKERSTSGIDDRTEDMIVETLDELGAFFTTGQGSVPRNIPARAAELNTILGDFEQTLPLNLSTRIARQYRSARDAYRSAFPKN